MGLPAKSPLKYHKLTSSGTSKGLKSNLQLLEAPLIAWFLRGPHLGVPRCSSGSIRNDAILKSSTSSSDDFRDRPLLN